MGSRAARTRTPRWRRLGFERLEDRSLLSLTDFAAITGRVYRDATGDGFTPGEQVAGATLQLYRDTNANGTLDAGDGSAVSSATTDTAGRFTFNRLTAGSYFVEQPAQTAGGITLTRQLSPLVEIDAAQAQGVIGRTIDAFTTVQSVPASLPVNTSANSAADATDALGGERDLAVRLTAGVGSDNVTLESGGGRLTFNPTFGAAGIYTVVWDGPDRQGDVLDHIGLRTGGQGVDLTQGGTSTAFHFTIGTSGPNSTATLRVYTDAANWSQAVIPLSDTSGESDRDYLVEMAQDFTVGAGSGADFTNVGAVVFEVVASTAAMDGQVTVIATAGPSVSTVDFANVAIADLGVTMAVDNPAPDVGRNVAFTLTLTNFGPATATNVQVVDLLPAGLTYVSATASEGDFHGATGMGTGTGTWTLLSLPSGTTATLRVTAVVTGAGTLTSTAQITAADQLDPNSADNQASASVTTTSADLSLGLTVDDATPAVDQTVTFTLTLDNAGPNAASAITVSAALPAGMTFARATPATGSYNGSSGIWTVDTLAAGGSATLQLTGTVATAGAKTVTAQVTAAEPADPDSAHGNNNPAEDDQKSVTISPPVADLVLTQTVSDPRPNLGDDVTFTLTLTNSGPDGTADVQVRDVLPPGMTYIRAVSSQGYYIYTDSDATGAWMVGSVPAGNTATLQLTATVDTTGAKVNTAEVSVSSEYDPDSTPINNRLGEDDQASVTVTPQVADLSLGQTADTRTPTVGDNITITVTLTNRGPDTATDVDVSDLLSAGLHLVSAGPSQGTYSYNDSNATDIWNVGSLAPGTTASLQIVATATEQGTQTNVAQVTARQWDPDSSSNSSILILVVTPSVEPQATVHLDSHAPHTADLLTATATKSGAGGRTVTLTFVWTVNGTVRQTHTSDTALTDTFDLSAADHGNRGDTITVEVTPSDGVSAGTVAIDTATVADSAPTGLTFSGISVAENEPRGMTVGTFSSTDPDAADTFTYTLVAGSGSTDNGAFTIDGSGRLLTAGTFNYEVQSSYTIRVRTSDQGGLSFEQPFTIAVTDVNETPTNLELSGTSMAENEPGGTTVGTFSSTDPNAADSSVPDARSVVFALFGSGGGDRRPDASHPDLPPPPSESPGAGPSPAVRARLKALTAGAPAGREQAESALLALLATDAEPPSLVAFDLGDDIVVPDPPPSPKPPDPSPDSGSRVPPPIEVAEEPSPPASGTSSATEFSIASRLFWSALPVLLAAAASATWYWRKTWQKWFAGVGWRAGLVLFAALGAARTTGLAAEPRESEPADPYIVVAKVRQLLTRGEYREAQDELRVQLDQARRNGQRALELTLLDLLADVQFSSGQHRDAEDTRRRYQDRLGSATYLSDALRLRELQQNLAKWADIQASAGRFAEAEQTWRRVLNAETQGPLVNPLEPARWRLKLAQAIASGGGAARERAQASFAEAAAESRRVLEAIARRPVDRATIAEAFVLLAECYGARERWPEAVAVLQTLLTRQGPDDPARSATLCELARYHHAAECYAEERHTLAEALRFFRRSAPDESLERMLRAAEIWDRLGQAAQAHEDRPSALHDWREAAQAYRRVCSHTDPPPTARIKVTALHNLRDVYLRSDELELARETAEELVHLLNSTRLAEDDPEYFSARGCLGSLFVKAQEYEKARPHLQAAHAYWERLPAPPPLEWALVLNAQGEVARAHGDMTKAAALLGRAHALYQQHLPPSALTLAEAAVNLGAVRAACGHYDPARRLYTQALKICEPLSSLPRANEVADTALLNLAMLYKSQGQFDDAAECCRKALTRPQATGKQAPGTFPYYYTMAALYLAKAEAGTPHITTQEALTQALQCVDEAQSTSEAQRAQRAYLRGSILFRQGKPDAAAAWGEALDISRTTGQAALEARILTRLCEAELRRLPKRPALGDASQWASWRAACVPSWRRAEQYARDAIARHTQTGAYPSLHFSALVHRAQIVRALAGPAGDEAQRNTSRALLREAVELTAEPRAMTTGAESERAQFFSQYAVAFDLLIDWSVQDGEPWEAWRYAEASRNRTFLDQVRAAGIDFAESLKGGDHEHLLDDRQDALYHYAAIRTQAALAAAGTDLHEVERLAGKLKACRETLQRLETQIRDNSPLYRGVLARAERLPTVEELRHVPRPDDLVLFYHLGARRCHLFVLSGSDRSPPVPLPLELDRAAAGPPNSPAGPLTRETLDGLVPRYLDAIRPRRELPQKSRGVGTAVVSGAKHDMTSDEARCLTNVLLPPAVRKRLVQHTRVVVVPDGPLHQLPFEALLWPDAPGYVLDHCPPIAYAPSAQILSVLRDRNTTRRAERSLLTVGNPTFPQRAVADQAARGLSSQAAEELDIHLASLPATAAECTAVEEACFRRGFARTAITKLLAADATESHVRQHLEQARILHFATHGLVDARRDNRFGALALTPPGQAADVTANNDGYLEHHEVHELSLTACDLVVLSACRTNIGPGRPLEANSTLTRAFLAAGAPRVVGSLWEVDDQSTAHLIAAFFDRLAEQWQAGTPANYARALQEARKQVKQKFAAPYYWAPFILIGPADDTDRR